MADAVQSGPAAAAASAALAALRERGAAQLDPVRFRFLEALAARAAAQQGAARRVLDARLAAAVADYAVRFAQAEDAARATLARAIERHPGAADELQQDFASGDFAALQRRAAGQDRAGAGTPLAALAACLAQHAAAHAEPSLAAAAPGEATADPYPATAPAELKSLRYFRDTWAKLSVERQLAQALAQAPENAGPLNSHRLVLRALEHMREVSPDYLNRFMAYADGLLWLAQADGIGAPAEKGGTTGDGEPKRKLDRGGARKGGDEGSRKR